MKVACVMLRRLLPRHLALHGHAEDHAVVSSYQDVPGLGIGSPAPTQQFQSNTLCSTGGSLCGQAWSRPLKPEPGPAKSCK